MSNTQDRSSRRGVSYSDSGLNSGKSYASGTGSLTDSQMSQVKSLWDSSRSNHKSTAPFKSVSSSEVLSNSRELMKKYLADKNTTNTDVGIVPGLNRNGELRSSYKPSVRLTSMNNGDTLDFEELNMTRSPIKVALNGNGEGDHWPFSFNYKGPKTKRDDQNAYRRELDRQIQAKKLIREQETEQLKRISRQKNPSSGRSKSSRKLPFLSKIEDNTRNFPQEIKNYHHSTNPELQSKVNPLEPMFLADQNLMMTANTGEQLMDTYVNATQSGYIQNIPQQQQGQMNSTVQEMSNFVNFANLPPNQFIHPQPQIGLVKDLNTGIYYQPISPMGNQQQFYYPTQQQQPQQINPQPQQSRANNSGTSDRDIRDHKKSTYIEDSYENVSKDEVEKDTSENITNSKDYEENDRDFNTLDTMNNFSAGYKAGIDYKPHVSESCVQRPESSVLRTNQKLILDRQIEEKRQFEKQKKAREDEQEVILQQKIKQYQEKMQLELQLERERQKEQEESKRIRHEKVLQKEEELRKETEERRKREKEERRKTLLALADQALESSEQITHNGEIQPDGKSKGEMACTLDDERPLPAPLRFREVSTQSTESSSNESICICCSASRGDLSSAATLQSIPETRECPIEMEVAPLLVDFTTALALEADRMKKLLNTLETKQKLRQFS